MRNERYTPVSIVPNSVFWRFANSFRLLLLSRPGILIGDDLLPGMLPARKQLYFPEHRQSHNWWYCALSTATVMLSCWFWIECLLDAWIQIMDQFNRLLSNLACSFSFEVSWNLIPERQSPICRSGPPAILKAFLHVSLVLAGLSLPQFAHFLMY